jgi:3-hydroxyacyl-[acyl-carrier-protein] dehydratase
MVLNREQIQEIIPHRDPFLLVDRITDIEPGKTAIGEKDVRIEEYYFKGHFPQEPIMPGVLIIEAIAQTGAVTLLAIPENSSNEKWFPVIR